jgi:hypothetical protein
MTCISRCYLFLHLFSFSIKENISDNGNSHEVMGLGQCFLVCSRSRYVHSLELRKMVKLLFL